MKNPYRNFAVLMVSMILMFSTAPFIILTAGLVGKKLAFEPSLRTLPVAMMIVGTVCATLPAGFLFRRLGYKSSFILAAVWSGAGALIAFWSVLNGYFIPFCLGAFMMGNNLAFAQQSRFVCLIGVSDKRKDLLVSVYLTGGIFAGLLGPQLAKATKDMIETAEFAGSYLAQAGMMAAGVVVLLLYRSPPVPAEKKGGEANSTGGLMLSPNFYYPMFCAMVSYAVMSLVMTATPLSMRSIRDFTFEETALVIQFHLLAMFVPSLFTGILIDRFGNFSVMFAGIAFFFISLIAAILGETFTHYMTALIFLGLGWNFMFISSTSLLVKLNEPGKLLFLQSKNDFCVFFGQASAALLSGTVLHHLGWLGLNGVGLVPMFLVLFLSLALFRRMASRSPAKRI